MPLGGISTEPFVTCPLHISSFISCHHAHPTLPCSRYPSLTVCPLCIWSREGAVLAPTSEPSPMQLLQPKMVSSIPSPGCLYLTIRYHLKSSSSRERPLCSQIKIVHILCFTVIVPSYCKVCKSDDSIHLARYYILSDWH